MILRQRRAAQRAEQMGYALIDCVLAMTLIGILSTIAWPRAAGFLDSLSVHGATSDAFAIFSTARASAVSSAAQSTVDIDTAGATMLVRVGQDTVLKRDFGQVHDVRISATRQSITYSANGMGYGAGNLTLVIRRGRAVDSLFVSRLGRVRH